MRKKLFALMLSLAILTTSPLFAMDAPEDERPGLGTVPKCVFTNHLMKELALPDVTSVFQVSKAFYTLSVDETVWESVVAKLGLSFDPHVNFSIRNQLRSFCENSVSNLTQKCSMSMETLQSFRKNLIPGSNPVSYDIKIGNIPLCMTYIQANDIGTGAHEVHLNIDFSKIDNTQRVIFSKAPDQHLFKSRFILLTKDDGIGGIVDQHGITLSSPEFMKRLNEVSTKFSTTMIQACTFTITPGQRVKPIQKKVAETREEGLARLRPQALALFDAAQSIESIAQALFLPEETIMEMLGLNSEKK